MKQNGADIGITQTSLFSISAKPDNYWRIGMWAEDNTYRTQSSRTIIFKEKWNYLRAILSNKNKE